MSRPNMKQTKAIIFSPGLAVRLFTLGLSMMRTGVEVAASMSAFSSRF